MVEKSMRDDMLCFVGAWGAPWVAMADCAVKSFVEFHPDIPVYYSRNPDFNNFLPPTARVEVMKAAVRETGVSKVILLGADTIVCARLDEFLDDNETDVICSLDYPYLLKTDRFTATEDQPQLNWDVTCFNNIEVIDKVLELTPLCYPYHEQGALNEIVYSDDYDYTFKIVDYPYEESSVVYNVRSKGNINPGEGAKPWAPYIRKFYVKEGKLFTGDHKQIKVWHYAEGFGSFGWEPSLTHEQMMERRTKYVNDLIGTWVRDWFNDETRQFFAEHCNCEDFFTSRSKQPA